MVTTNISLVLSGGVSNQDPAQALGGPPSSSPIDDVLNNLFDDVTGQQVASGYTDYRCFYVFNDSDENLDIVSLWVESQYPLGSEADLGVTLQNEVQQIVIFGSVGGTFQLDMDSEVTDDIAYDTVPLNLANNVQEALRLLPNSAHVLVTPIAVDQIQVTWQGRNGNRRYPLLILASNDLVAVDVDTTPGINFVSVTAGSPINAIAPDIGIASNPPSGISFQFPMADSPLVVGVLQVNEGFPVWIRRLTTPETEPTALDGISIAISADRVLGQLI